MCSKEQAECLAKRHEAEIQAEIERQRAISDVLEAFDDELSSIEMAEAIGITIVSCNGSFASVDIGGVRGRLVR